MRKILLFFVLGIPLLLSVNSCKTGYSKGSYIVALEKFVNKVEKHWMDYDEKEWERADERMEAFKEKYDKYADDFTKEEKRTVAKLMVKYQVLRGKSKVNGFWQTIKSYFETGEGVIEELFEGFGGEIERWADSINAMVQ